MTVVQDDARAIPTLWEFLWAYLPAMGQHLPVRMEAEIQLAASSVYDMEPGRQTPSFFPSERSS